jgi:hypothetical protein
MKQFVRQKSDQTFQTMMRLIPESREQFATKNIELKLFRQFWKAVDACKKGDSYGQVVTLFFSGLCKAEVLSHRKITNTNLD